MKSKYVVYYHRNKIDNKYYIGITSRKPKDRWGINGCNYYTQYFGYIIKQIGWNNFEHVILFENLSESEAKQKEIEMIRKYNSLYPNGYNYTKGGDIMPNDIICLETGEIINNDEEDIQKFLDDNFEYFRGKIKPIDIIDCCKYYIRKIKAYRQDKYFHFGYIKNHLTVEDCDEIFDYAVKRRSKKRERYDGCWSGDFKMKGKLYKRCTCKKCGEQFTMLKNGEEDCNINTCKRCFNRYKKSYYIY